jgi:hypothetical protein
MKKLLAGIFLSGLVCFVTACYYDKEELLYGVVDAPCTDTITTNSYSQQVVPLLNQYCYGCHTGNYPSGGILMGTYTQDRTLAQNGKLSGSINHSPGYSPMPQGMPKLNNCAIASIQRWIDNGMLNN